MTPEQFRQLAAYNRWANARLYAAALDLSNQAYRLHIGVFFGSLHGTLNHLLLTDRLWLKRLTGEGDHPNPLDAILYEDRAELTGARVAEDNRLVAVIDKYDDAALTNLHSYKTTSGMPQSQVLVDILLHLFNHQTPSSRAGPCLPVHSNRWRTTVTRFVGLSAGRHCPRPRSADLKSARGYPRFLNTPPSTPAF